MPEDKNYIAEDVPWYSVGKGEKGPWTDEDCAMSAPHTIVRNVTWQEAYIAAAEHVAENAKSDYIIRSGESPMYAAAAVMLAAASTTNYFSESGVRLHGRYVRVRKVESSTNKREQ